MVWRFCPTLPRSWITGICSSPKIAAEPIRRASADAGSCGRHRTGSPRARLENRGLPEPRPLHATARLASKTARVDLHVGLHGEVRTGGRRMQNRRPRRCSAGPRAGCAIATEKPSCSAPLKSSLAASRLARPSRKASVIGLAHDRRRRQRAA